MTERSVDVKVKGKTAKVIADVEGRRVQFKSVVFDDRKRTTTTWELAKKQLTDEQVTDVVERLVSDGQA